MKTVESSVENSKRRLELQYFENRERLEEASLKVVISFLKNSHNRYRSDLTPKIEQLFMHVMEFNPELPALNILFNLFYRFSSSLNVHMLLEEKNIFNRCEAYFEDGFSKNPFESHQAEEPYLTEIISYLRRIDLKNETLKSRLITNLEQFNVELQEHAWIEENILAKKIQSKISADISQHFKQ